MTNYPNSPDYTFYCNIWITCTCSSNSGGSNTCSSNSIITKSVKIYSKLYCTNNNITLIKNNISIALNDYNGNVTDIGFTNSSFFT